MSWKSNQNFYNALIKSALILYSEKNTKLSKREVGTPFFVAIIKHVAQCLRKWKVTFETA